MSGMLEFFFEWLRTSKILIIFILVTLALWRFAILPAYRQYSVRRTKIHQHGCQPPPSLPRKDPIFGVDVAFRMFQSYRSGQRSATFKAQHEQYGPTFQSVALGKTRIFTIDPANLRAIFSTNFHDWGVQPLRLGPWGPMLGKGVMNMDGLFWKHSREMVQPLFRREQAFDLVTFDRHVARLLELLPRHRETVDLQPLFARLILDFTTEFLFGECCDCLTSEPNEDAVRFLDAFHYGQAAIGKRTQLPYLSIFTTDQKFWRAVRMVQDFVRKLVDHAALRCAEPPKEESHSVSRKRYVLADELLRTHSDATDIRNQLLNTFLAAHDTTAVLMTNVFFHLARHPAVYAKLRAELLSADSASLTDPDTIKSLPYLHHVLLETSRLTPVVGQSARMALHDTILPSGGGTDNTAPVYVTAGTSVQFNFFTLHRRELVFGPDAGAYRPERWDAARVGHWDFLPFIAGPRTCPAQEMAVLQVKYVVARMVVGSGSGQQSEHSAAFSGIQALENRDECWEFVERYRITADSRNGCKVALNLSC
ncbi:MAG: hypothetical protein LQ351_007832 [Letrouitia transgressa]|nr:MAG: hypothetical protein LQ351_007832 [Letrouitia transgressa]